MLKGIIKRALSLRPSTSNDLFCNILYRGRWADLIHQVQSQGQVGQILSQLFPSEDELGLRLDFVRQLTPEVVGGVPIKCPRGHNLGHPFQCLAICVNNLTEPLKADKRRLLLVSLNRMRAIRTALGASCQGQISASQMTRYVKESIAWRKLCKKNQQ